MSSIRKKNLFKMVLEELDQLFTENISILKTSCRTSSFPDLKGRNETVNVDNVL